MDPRVQGIIAFLSSRLHQSPTLDEMACQVNLSPSRLHRLFKDETGISPYKYLKLLRMGHARELLETSFLSVKQIMSRVGVSDESHFVRDFKKFYGLTPAQYRANFFSDESAKSGSPVRFRRVPVAASTRPHSPARGRAGLAQTASAPPPLLLRRPTHPLLFKRPARSRGLARNKSAPFANADLDTAVELLLIRNIEFSQITADITAKMVRGLLKRRSIHYRVRGNTGARRRLPPAVEQPQPPSRRRLERRAGHPRLYARGRATAVARAQRKGQQIVRMAILVR